MGLNPRGQYDLAVGALKTNNHGVLEKDFKFIYRILCNFDYFRMFERYFLQLFKWLNKNNRKFVITDFLSYVLAGVSTSNIEVIISHRQGYT